MDGNLIAYARSTRSEIETARALLNSSTERIIDFYEQAGADYAHWSRDLNMHLGFYRRGMDPFDRDAMLEQMNLEVALRLGDDPKANSTFLDLGCGVGSVARSIAGYFSNSHIKGYTLAPSQVRIASDLNFKSGLGRRIKIEQGDYSALPLDDRSADGAWAIESACYATGPDKADLIHEVARVLKQGGRLVVADCFLKCPAKDLNPFVRRAYRAVCESWALSEMPLIDDFVSALERNGFRNIIVEDISWRTAPSLAHAPFAVLTFVIKKLLAREPLKRHSINNLKASLLALVLGLNRSAFSYCLIHGTLGEK
jgi:ubiquinone/menaquinone biosynthesis C-methylase UbiE